MRVPVATYRLQLGAGMGFDEAAALLPYLDSLGVDTLYLSPIFEHAGGGGYHVTDPNAIAAGHGGERGFARLAAACRERRMGILLDIVPNHLSTRSPMWEDVLARGRASRFAPWFDVDWERHGGRVVVPTLPEPGPPVVEGAAIRTWWREALGEVSYRRFFDIDELVGLRQEDPDVFEETHRLVLRLVHDGLVSGLRVDHVDGLRDPLRYLERLRAAAGDAYLVVEKILAEGEELRPEWPVQGTTGYEVADAIARVLTDARGAERCDALAVRLTGDPTPWPEVRRAAKRQVLRDLFAGEVRRLAEELARLHRGQALGAERLSDAVREVMASLPVYRTYVQGPEVVPADRELIERTVVGPGADPEALALLREVLLHPAIPAHQALIDRWQQLSGPAAAKGIEDTALYRHVGLVSRNMVGGEPAAPPLLPAGFHRAMTSRAARWPHAMSATSTHDTKRSEDTVARIAALAELSEAWEEAVRRWDALLGDRPAPSPAERLLLFQTLVGTWNGSADTAYVERIGGYLVKAAREAKLRTSWLDPDDGHEEGLRRAVAELLGSAAFVEELSAFVGRVAVPGAVNALAQVVLRTTLPGVPDLYRGAESWYLRLVDPDNRAPVDHGALVRMLEDLGERAGELPRLAEELRTGWADGRLKLLVTAATLRARREDPATFLDGAYLPIQTEGPAAEHALVFARRRDEGWAVAVVPRLPHGLAGGAWPIGEVWGATRLRLPAGAPETWTDAISGAEVAADAGALPLEAVLRHLPVALLLPRRLR